MEKQIVKTVKDWECIADELLTKIDPSGSATVLALSGDLGVGKTTFVQALAKQLGVSEPVTSPTFTLMKRYETTDKKFPNLLHMDAYRIDSVEELVPLRFDELLKNPNTLFCVEWAECIKDALPGDTLFLRLTIDDQGRHIIQSES